MHFHIRQFYANRPAKFRFARIASPGPQSSDLIIHAPLQRIVAGWIVIRIVRIDDVAAAILPAMAVFVGSLLHLPRMRIDVVVLAGYLEPVAVASFGVNLSLGLHYLVPLILQVALGLQRVVCAHVRPAILRAGPL